MTTSTTFRANEIYGAGTRILLVSAFLAGAALVYTVGFSHSATIHNAAHDSRHAMAFPCH